MFSYLYTLLISPYILWKYYLQEQCPQGLMHSYEFVNSQYEEGQYDDVLVDIIRCTKCDHRTKQYH